MARHGGLSADVDLSRSQIEHLINEWVFSERDRQILKRRLLDGLTFDKLAEEFDLSVRQVKNIVYRQGERVYNHSSYFTAH